MRGAVWLSTLALAAVFLVPLVLLSPVVAEAQLRTGASPAEPPAAGVTPQNGAQAYYLSLLQLYGLQSTAAAAPATRVEIAQAMSEYMTNGAKATGVPTSGPAASYFTRGAQMSTVPTTTIPNYSFSPAFPTAESPARQAPVSQVAPPPELPDAATASPTPPAVAPPAPTDDGSATTMDGAAAAVIPVATEPTTPESAPAPAPESAPASESAAAPAPESAAARAPMSAPESRLSLSPEAVPEPSPTSARTILVPMALGVALAGLLVFLGLSIRPH